MSEVYYCIEAFGCKKNGLMSYVSALDFVIDHFKKLHAVSAGRIKAVVFIPQPSTQAISISFQPEE